MKRKMSDKHQLMAYVLSTDEDLNRNKKITQKDIAGLFGVGQSTVADAIKDARYKLREMSLERENDYLQQQLREAKMEAMNLKGIQELSLPEKVDSEFKRKM